jgi:hypothetical protein
MKTKSEAAQVRKGSILLQESKIERKPRSADTMVRGRFCVKRFGPPAIMAKRHKTLVKVMTQMGEVRNGFRAGGYWNRAAP